MLGWPENWITFRWEGEGEEWIRRGDLRGDFGVPLGNVFGAGGGVDGPSARILFREEDVFFSCF